MMEDSGTYRICCCNKSNNAVNEIVLK